MTGGVDWLAPGVYLDVPSRDYHRDPCREPSLSAHIAQRLITRSPLHAWTDHPRLNPDHERVDDSRFDVGTAAHSMLLEGDDDRVHVCDYADWRSKAAQAERDHAREDGLTPMLAYQHEKTCAMVASVRRQLETLDLDPPVFQQGEPEATLVWEDDGGIMCRARLDWLHHDARAVDDLKTTSVSGRPEVWGRRTFWNLACDIQSAFYLRGLRKLADDPASYLAPAFRYVVAECDPPYAVSVLTPAASTLALGAQKVEVAIRKWGQCLETGRWPAYAADVYSVELEGWQDAEFLRLTYAEQEAA